MPTTEQNFVAWEHDYEWSAEGDEWSVSWGTAAAQWHGCLLPRLRHFLPARHILEIAPGHGRWTQYLLDLAERLTIVDLSPACIEVCGRRFARHEHIEYVVNDGRSLTAVADASIDLVFSFDSLVHVEADTINDYLHEICRVLGPDGAAFVHHSNIGQYVMDVEREADALPATHSRALSVTADRFDEMASAAGLRCISQELIAWGGERLIDSISVVTPPGSRFERTRPVVENPWFMAEARSIRAANQAFSASGEPALR